MKKKDSRIKIQEKNLTCFLELDFQLNLLIHKKQPSGLSLLITPLKSHISNLKNSFKVVKIKKCVSFQIGFNESSITFVLASSLFP